MSLPGPSHVALVGATGLTGSHILQTLLGLSATHPRVQLTALTRRPLPEASSRYNNIVGDLGSAELPQSTSGAFISALATTKEAAGSIEAQRKVDVGLNADLARKARSAGYSTYVLVSSKWASASARTPYLAIKGELEDAIKGMGFERVVILQPAFLLRDHRDESVNARPYENWSNALFGLMRRVRWPTRDWAVRVEDVATCAAHYALEPPSQPVTILSNREIIETAARIRQTSL